MSQHAERSEKPATPPIGCPAAAERPLTPSQRRKEALRCLTIELCETEVDALIRRGLLKADACNDRLAVMNALHAHLDGSLGT
jgi:hypothetical protein